MTDEWSTKFTKYLKESFGFASDHHFSFKNCLGIINKFVREFVMEFVGTTGMTGYKYDVWIIQGLPLQKPLAGALTHLMRALQKRHPYYKTIWTKVRSKKK